MKKFTTIAIFPLKEILSQLSGIGIESTTLSLLGYEIDLKQKRYRIFKSKGVKCSRCNRRGSYFKLQQDEDCENKNKGHLHLYGKDKNGYEFIMTVDHIIPVSKGGTNHCSNLQPMCYRCNAVKSNKFPK